MQRHIIQSLLDTDLYKFTMLQVVLHQFPQAHGVYEFRCRNLDECVYPLVEIRSELEAELLQELGILNGWQSALYNKRVLVGTAVVLVLVILFVSAGFLLAKSLAF